MESKIVSDSQQPTRTANFGRRCQIEKFKDGLRDADDDGDRDTCQNTQNAQSPVQDSWAWPK